MKIVQNLLAIYENCDNSLVRRVREKLRRKGLEFCLDYMKVR